MQLLPKTCDFVSPDETDEASDEETKEEKAKASSQAAPKDSAEESVPPCQIEKKEAAV